MPVTDILMPSIYLRKVGFDALRVEDETGAEELQRVKLGAVIKVEWVQPRNYAFLKKFYAMLRLAFDAWEPSAGANAFVLEKNFDSFREQAIILAGFVDATYSIAGDVTLRAKSIAFGKMREDEFENLYGKVATVLLERVLSNYTRADLDRVVDELLRFT